jgi:hypothetical protein
VKCSGKSRPRYTRGSSCAVFRGWGEFYQIASMATYPMKLMLYQGISRFAASRAGSSTLTISYGKLTKSPIVTNAYTQFQLALIAVYTDGTSKDVTLEAQWYISHSSTVGVRNFSRMTVDNGMITTAGG